MPAAKAQPVDVRERILEHATRLFAKRGFEGASLKDIAEAVGIRKPSLLYHYPSKDELRGAVLAHLLDRWNDLLPRLLVAATSPEGQFDAVIGETVRFLTEDPDRARLLLREVLDRPQAMGKLIHDHVRPWVNIICNYIRKGQQQGTVHADVVPEAYVVNCMSLVLSNVATHDCLRSFGAEAADSYTRELLRIAKSSLFRRREEI
jgi:AcrR family transcriptional regulator